MPKYLFRVHQILSDEPVEIDDGFTLGIEESESVLDALDVVAARLRDPLADTVVRARFNEVVVQDILETGRDGQWELQGDDLRTFLALDADTRQLVLRLLNYPTDADWGLLEQRPDHQMLAYWISQQPAYLRAAGDDDDDD